jgi:hypothetical protein
VPIEIYLFYTFRVLCQVIVFIVAILIKIKYLKKQM